MACLVVIQVQSSSSSPGEKSCLLALADRVGLGAQVGGGGAGLREVAAKGGLDERSEDELSTAEGGQTQPQKEDKLEGEVKGEPVDNVHQRLDDGEEGKNDPVSEPLGIIDLVSGEQGLQRVVARDDKARNVGQELATQVEDDEKEVQGDETNDSVDLGNGGLLLKVVESRVLGKLLVELGDILLNAILSRHLGYE